MSRSHLFDMREPDIACILCGGPAKYLRHQNSLRIYNCSSCQNGKLEFGTHSYSRKATAPRGRARLGR